MDFFADVTKLIDRANARQLFLATATGNSTGNLEEITRDGQNVADTQRWPTISTVPALTAGNRLLVWSDGVQCVIIGKIDS